MVFGVVERPSESAGGARHEAAARADAAVLQRDTARAGMRGGTVDCLPLQVFTEPQHIRR